MKQDNVKLEVAKAVKCNNGTFVGKNNNKNEQTNNHESR
jgi:hypothetical protein